MKTKTQKQEEIKKGAELLTKSRVLVFTDFTKVPAEEYRKLRNELHVLGAKVMVIKKRLLNILMKEKQVDFDARKYKFSVGTIFSPADIEKVSAVVFKFFKSLGNESEKEKILGGFDLERKQYLEADLVQMIGQLPPREVLLGQVLGMIASPIRSLLYVLKEKSNKMVEQK